MAEHEFSGEDLVALARKLDQLAQQLTERERALLLATFQMAGDQLNRLASGGGGGFESTELRPAADLPTLRIANVEALPPLSEGFRNSFVKGGASNLGGAKAVEWDASVSVMGGMLEARHF